jgi:hypothetical protein
VVKDSAAYCNAVSFPPIVVASGYFGYVGYHQMFLCCTWLLFCNVLELLKVYTYVYSVIVYMMLLNGSVWFVGCGCLECSCWVGSFVVFWSAILVLRCGCFRDVFVLLPPLWGVLCAALWCLFPVPVVMWKVKSVSE